MSLLTRSALFVPLLALCLHIFLSYWHWEDSRFHWKNDNKEDEAEKFFSFDYYDARALFRHHARQVDGATLYGLPIRGVKDHDLTIDLAVIKGSDENVLLHISGTHGVEGFAGSAIQCALLQRFYNDTENKNDDNNDSEDKKGVIEKIRNDRNPTVIFVHGLNPYGFAKLRRWNENNVDLNRNNLSPPNKFTERQSLDPNRHGYDDFMHMLNPPHAIPTSWWQDLFWIRCLYYIARYGFVTMKKAIVTGTYHHPKGIFYGGSELQQSHKLLRQFVRDHVNLDKVKNFVVIDVHTGLGPPGFDSIIMDHDLREKMVSILGGDDETKQHVVGFGGSSGAGSGYDDVVGDTKHGFDDLFSPEQTSLLPVTQEFGTVPGILVFKALREENADFHYAPWNRIASAEKVRDVFYLRNSVKWKRDVIVRGTNLFWALFKYLEKEKAS